MLPAALIDRDVRSDATPYAPGDSVMTDMTERPRLRFVGCRLERGPGAYTRVTVSFAGSCFPDGTFVCRQEGTTSEGGDLRLVAVATFEALAVASRGAFRFELIGVKPVRAFDTVVMMVAALVRDHGEVRQGERRQGEMRQEVRRVVGAAIVDGDAMAATVRAALHAANRVAAPLLGSLGTPDDC